MHSLGPRFEFFQVFWATSKLKTVGFRALMLPLRYPCKSKITLQSKFQPNRTSGSGDIAIFCQNLTKIWPQLWDPWANLIEKINVPSSQYGAINIRISALQVKSPGSSSRSKVENGDYFTVLASSLDHTFLDWTTLWGCLSELADLADGWVRRGGPIY